MAEGWTWLIFITAGKLGEKGGISFQISQEFYAVPHFSWLKRGKWNWGNNKPEAEKSHEKFSGSTQLDTLFRWNDLKAKDTIHEGREKKQNNS